MVYHRDRTSTSTLDDTWLQSSTNKRTSVEKLRIVYGEHASPIVQQENVCEKKPKRQIQSRHKLHDNF